MPDKLFVYLFVYGTLHPDRAPAEIADAVRNFVAVGRGKIRGKLLDLGTYPGVIVGPAYRDEIPGTVFKLPDDPVILARLDQYEDFRPDDLPNSSFVRAHCDVTLEDGSRMRCWVYLYNREYL